MINIIKIYKYNNKWYTKIKTTKQSKININGKII